MYRYHPLLRPQIAGYGAVALLSCAGALTFLLLLLELWPPAWSRPALALQGLAGVLALLLTYWHQPRRFLLYPIVLAGVIYLWDTTLPPPSLPEGPLRRLIPLAVLVGLLVDLLVTLHRRPQPAPRAAPHVHGTDNDLDSRARLRATTGSDHRSRLRRAHLFIMLPRRARPAPRNATRIYGGYMELGGAAQVLDTTPADLRARLRRLRRITVARGDGTEFLSLDDLRAVLAHWNQEDERRNGREHGSLRDANTGPGGTQMLQVLMLGRSVQCRDGKGVTLKEIVVDPQPERARLDYIVVHRGLLRGHDHCVPAGNIGATNTEGVTLDITTEELQALSDIESTVPGQSYTQRCIPDRCLVLDTATRIIDTTGCSLGQLQGVMIDEDRSLVRILPSKDDTHGMAASAVIAWSEDALTVQFGEPEAPA